MGMWDSATEGRIASRFLGRVDVGLSPAGCWLWTGHCFHTGYGCFKIGERNCYAHRVAYELLAGVIPEGLQLDHLCREKACVNPLHLEPVTASENKRRDRSRNAEKTHCPHGHPFDAENTYVDARGWRGCRACRQESKRRYRRRA